MKLEIKKQNKKLFISAIVIFIIALFLRIYNLGGSSIGVDEGLWMQRGSNMITYLNQGKFKESVKNFERHPGIPAAFLMGLSMKTLSTTNTKYQYDIAAPASFSLKILDPLVAARLPIAILGALTCLFLFIFLYHIFSSYRMAFFVSLLLVFSPFHIAASRMAHQDIALSLFIMISLFSFFLGEKKNKDYLKIIAGIFFGLAFLTKVIALIIPFVIFVWKIVIYALKNKKESFRRENIFTYTDVFALLSGFLMFFMLYPAMWTNPPHSFVEHLLQNFSRESVKDDHFFMGQATHANTPFFYLVSLFFRIPAAELILFLIGFLFLIKRLIKKRKKETSLFLLISFLIIIFSLINISKVQERYLIALWEFIPIFTGIGIIFIMKKLKIYKKPYFIVLILLTIIAGSYIYVKNVPNFYLYYNIFIGDPNNMTKIMPVGRGEGIREAAEYLNKKQKELGQTLNVFSTYSSYFKTYSESNVISWNDRAWNENNINEGIDYYVIYIRDIQDHSPDLLYKKIFLSQKPETIIKLNNINVAWIFKNN